MGVEPLRLPDRKRSRALSHRSRTLGFLLTVAAGVLFVSASLLVSASAVEGQLESGRPNVFFDCEGRDCNSQYYRTEINWVNWVNDQEVADLHVIMTSTRTGVGGREYRLDFIGREDAAAYEDQLLWQTLPTDTDRERLDGLAHVLGLGMARFGAAVGYRDLVRLEGPNPESSTAARVVSRREVDDPWDLWVFRVNGNLNLDGEALRSTRRVNTGFNASRVTPTWKFNFDSNVNYQRQEVELEDGTFTDTRVDWNVNPTLVYAVAEHWSVGLQGQTARMTRVNQDFRWEVTPAVEYSVFPYEEATRRAFTFGYKVGPAYRKYIEETLFGETSELRFEQSLEIELSQRQTWGDASLTLRGSHYLHDVDLYNVSLRGNIDFRIIRGLSVNARANVGWVEDQIYLSAEGATDEEALLELRQRGTDFDYGVSVGLSFQFGSIFNNVVNNRFRGVSGFGGGRFR